MKNSYLAAEVGAASVEAGVITVVVGAASVEAGVITVVVGAASVEAGLVSEEVASEPLLHAANTAIANT